MTPSPFDFNDYREYLRQCFPTKGEGRGGRVRLAALLGVQKAFVSAVLNGKLPLSLEHALKISQQLGQRADERDYFLLQVQEDRAGSRDLQQHFREKLEEIRVRRSLIQERISVKESLAERDQILYYSSWHYTAVHMCLMVPTLQTADAISRYLGLSRQTVIEILEFFLATGLARQEHGRFVAGPARLHIPADSPFVSKHHSNWRVQSLQALDRRRKEELHYSLVMSISKEAMEKIREILTRAIETSEVELRKSKDEGVYALTMDLFELRSGIQA